MYIPIMQVRNSEVIVYEHWTGPRKLHKQENPFSGSSTYSGRMTNGSVKRLQKAVTLLVQKSPRVSIYNPVAKCHHPFRLSFVTLTIADQGKDNAKDVYRKVMAKWLRWGRRAGMTDYIWKAELQQRRTLHYHIATNKFLHWRDIRDTWNTYQKKAGYLQQFAAKYGHFKPNSTDVHSIRKVRNIERYLTKYMMKGVGNSQIVGKTWDCSKNLKDASYFSTEMTPRNLHLIRSIAKKEIRTDHCTIFRIPQDAERAVLDGIQRQEFNIHLKSI